MFDSLGDHACGLEVEATRPYLLVGWLWYLGTMVPAIGFVQFGVQSVADRFTYFTQIGLAIALVWTGTDVVRSASKHSPAAGWRGHGGVIRSGSRWADDRRLATGVVLARTRDIVDARAGLRL